MHNLNFFLVIFIVECKKDLLLIVDTSYSIGQSDFEAKIKPFLKNLVKDPQLNVGPEGTHVGLILFSSEQKTRSKLRIGEIEDADQLAGYMNNLRYTKISGDRTRTELALDLAKQVRTLQLNVSF